MKKTFNAANARLQWMRESYEKTYAVLSDAYNRNIVFEGKRA